MAEPVSTRTEGTSALSPEPTLHTSNSSYTSRTPHPPRTRHTDRRPCTHPSHLHSPCTHHHTPRTPHTHLTRPASTLQTPRSACIHPTHLVDSGYTPHTWHIAQTPHPSLTHTPQTLLSPRTHPPHSARAHRRLRVRRARSQRSCSLLPAESESAPPGGAGGKRRLRCASPTRDSAGGSSSSRGRGRELLATLRGPRSPSPPARSLSPAPRVAGDPRDPRPGPCRRPRPLPAAAFLSTHRSPPSSPSAALDRKLAAQPRPPTPTPPRPPPAI